MKKRHLYPYLDPFCKCDNWVDKHHWPELWKITICELCSKTGLLPIPLSEVLYSYQK